MRPSSITIKSIDGKLYKITDLIKGIKEPLMDSDLKQYDMYPQSGVFKDLDGNLVDLVDLIGKGSGDGLKEIEFVDTLPEIPKESVVYVNRTDKSIYYFLNGEWIKTSGDIDANSILSKDKYTTTSEIQSMLTVFNI